MAKSPLIRDTLLAGEIAAVLVASPESVHATINGVRVTSANLRKMADELDRLEAARNVFFDLKEYAVTFQTLPASGQAEDSVIVLAATAQDAVAKFNEGNHFDYNILDVFNRQTQQSESFE